MPCNCGRSTQQFIYRYTSPSGSTTNYPTEIEAKAAKIRSGGGSIQTIRK
jgi:hypothetical protein